MKLLLDENLSHRLRPLILGHEVFSVKYLGWRGIRNGALIERAATEGFDALITFDSGIEYEQNLSALPCSVILLVAETSSLEHLTPLIPKLLIELAHLRPKSFIRIS